MPGTTGALAVSADVAAFPDVATAPHEQTDEHVVLLDRAGHPCGTTPKATAHHRHTELHQGFSCYLARDDGRYLLTRRAEHKRTWPGWWSNSCCGHPQLGETLREAVQRRLHVELGVTCERLAVVLPDFAYRAAMDDGTVEHELCPVVVAVTTDDVEPNPEEVAEVEWVEWADLAARAAAGYLSPWCTEQVALLGDAPPRVDGGYPHRGVGATPELDRRLAVVRLPEPVQHAGASPFAPVSGAVDAELDAFVEQRVRELERVDPALGELAQSVGHLLDAGGKRLRPAFVYWGHRAAGVPHDDGVMRVAAAMEMLHTFALLQDDVMDRSATRRGRPTAHAVFADSAPLHRRARAHDREWFGASAAVLASDLAFVWADELLDTASLPADALARARAIFGTLRTEVVCGQFLDLAATSDPGSPQAEVDVRRVALLKSARYTVTRPLLLGAALAPGPDERLACVLRRYGDALGRAFQMRDDVLGLFGDPAVTGKSACDDLREGKRTLLIVRALRMADPAGHAVLVRGLGDPDLDEAAAERCREVVARSGALASVEALIRHDRDVATSAAGCLAPAARDGLLTLAATTTQRRS